MRPLLTAALALAVACGAPRAMDHAASPARVVAAQESEITMEIQELI